MLLPSLVRLRALLPPSLLQSRSVGWLLDWALARLFRAKGRAGSVADRGPTISSLSRGSANQRVEDLFHHPLSFRGDCYTRFNLEATDCSWNSSSFPFLGFFLFLIAATAIAFPRPSSELAEQSSQRVPSLGCGLGRVDLSAAEEDSLRI